MVKVQFGSGPRKISGWQNLDKKGHDVREKLKFDDNSVDFIFHEHLIEHLDEVDGYNFLKECYRILKPNGVMRISCPDISGIVSVYMDWDNIPDNEWKKKHGGDKTKFINNVMINQTAFYKGKRFDANNKSYNVESGAEFHKYYYDKNDFRRKLTEIGFTNFTLVNKHESEHPELRKLERRVGGKYKYFPSVLDITLEVTK